MTIRMSLTLSLLGASFVAAGGCSGGGEGPAGPGPKQACAIEEDCDDDNPCTAESCGSDDLCVRNVLPDGPTDEVQGDCQSVVCTAGVPVVLPNSGDIDDDGEPCTLEQCENGTTVHLPHIDDASCSFGGNDGVCRSGRCMVACTTDPLDSACEDENPCTVDSCEPCAESECVSASICAHARLDEVSVPGLTDTEGDCRAMRCIDGEAREVLEPADVVVDGDPCTADVCIDGKADNPKLPDGASCGGESVCTTGLCAPPCVLDGSCLGILVYSSYDGGPLTIDVDIDIPRMGIGMSSHEPMTVTLTGAQLSRVEVVHYAGAGGDQTTITGVDPSKIEILSSPPVTLTDPDGYDTGIICNFAGSGDHGGCNSAEQIVDYFEKTLNGELIVHGCDYDAPNSPLVLSGGGSCQ